MTLKSPITQIPKYKSPSASASRQHHMLHYSSANLGEIFVAELVSTHLFHLHNASLAPIHVPTE